MINLLFNKIEYDKWERIAKGAPVTIDPKKLDGIAENAGFKIQWLYNKNEKTLRIDVLDKPWIASDSFVKDRILSLVERA